MVTGTHSVAKIPAISQKREKTDRPKTLDHPLLALSENSSEEGLAF
jgi:hypothetical protein